MVQQNMVYVPHFAEWPILSCLPSPASTTPFWLVLLVTQPGSLASTSQWKEPADVVDGSSRLDSGKQGDPCAGTHVRSCLLMPQNTEWQSLEANFLQGTFQACMAGWST